MARWWFRSSIRRASAPLPNRSTPARRNQSRGFLDAKIVPQGVAVFATSTWPAFRAKGLVKVEWDEENAEKRGATEILAEYRRLADQSGTVARNDGDAEAALGSSAQVVEAEFTFPYLAHAAMEPMNAVVKFDGDTVRIWSGSQMQTVDQVVADAIFGVPPARVLIDTKYAGGSFGRRAVPNWDYLAEAATAVKAWGKPDPVKLVWRRGDDTRGGFTVRYTFTASRQASMGLGISSRGSTSSLGSRSSPAQDREGLGEKRCRCVVGRGRDRHALCDP